MSVKFTEKAEQILLQAGDLAKRQQHDFVGTEHLLWSVLQQSDSLATQALASIGVSVEQLESSLSQALQEFPSNERPTHIPFTPHAKRCLEIAGEEAIAWGQSYITTEHILLGVLMEEEGNAARILTGYEVTREKVQEYLYNTLGDPREAGKDQKYQFQQPQQPKLAVLEAFSIDLTEQAAMGKLEPVIGREKEIQRLIQILSRKTKNNPVVIGEPGVGKTAIVEGLSQKIANREVPEVLAQKRVISLDLAAVLAGTKYRGEFEKRIKSIIKEVVEARNIILFIDELHTMMGAGASESSLDASNILKPPLSRGDIQCIGATTLDEYRKHIEKDGAMERRFQVLIVDPPTEDQTVEILKGLRDGFEAHHRVRITDAAVAAAVELSSRYISGRFLPDKAIDVLDEACSRERLSRATRPPDIAPMEEEIVRLEREKNQAVHGQDFELAAQLRDSVEKQKRRKDELLISWRRSSKEVDGVVDAREIAEAVALMTGIPSSNLSEEDTARLSRMQEALHEMVVSQDHAVDVVCKAIRRSRAGLKDPNRPLGSFIFVGPSGVGKTLLAKALARFLFGDEESLTILDMSEYMEKHSISKLIGSPPGYVGFEEGGQLTEKIRRKPYSVLLLDEIEKAHPDFTNLLLQVLEEGRLTDSFGRAVDFRNSIVIMTSNLGMEQENKRSSMGFRRGSSEDARESHFASVRQQLDGHFRPEFMNRLDAVVTFDFLSSEAVHKIFQLELAKVQKRLARRNIRIDLSPEAVDLLVQIGYSDKSGARGLRRILEERVEDPLSEMIIMDQVHGEDTVSFCVEEGRLRVEVLHQQKH